jgi:hypothetical protein
VWMSQLEQCRAEALDRVDVPGLRSDAFEEHTNVEAVGGS